MSINRVGVRSKYFKKVVGGLLGAALVAGATAVAADSGKYKIRMLASPSGAGPYNAFSTIKTHLDEFTTILDIDVEETQGANFHVKYMLKRPAAHADTVFWTGTVVNWAAATGQKPFYPKAEATAEDFRIIAVMGRTYNVWVSMDKAVQTPQDFAGKKVGIGLLSQNEWGMHQRMLLDAWDITPKLRSLDILGPGQNIDALLDGREDVGTLFGLLSADETKVVVTGPHRKLESTTRPWHYVNVPRELVDDYTKRTGAPFKVVALKPDTLPNQPDKLTTFGDLLIISAHKSFPEPAAYELVRMLIDNYDEISKYSAFTKTWTPDTLAYSADEHPETFHPGALRAFREFGLIDTE